MSDRLLVSTRKGLFTLRRGPSGWSVTDGAMVGDNISLTERDPRTGHIYAGLDHGHFGVKLHRSTDDGGTYEEIGTPTYPEKPEDWVDPVSDDDSAPKPPPWSLKKIWSITPGSAEQDGVLWCGTIPGGLFRSGDHGASWELVESLWYHDLRKQWFGGGADWPGVHSVLVDPRDADHVTLGVSCGGNWDSRDGGATWNPASKGMRAEYMPPELAYGENHQDPHCTVRCAAEPDKLWVQHHNGIFRSVDDGANWTELSENAKPSAFGFPVAVHPNDGETAWFVPAIKDEKRCPVDGKVVVSRTRDGGASFEVLSKGLPQSHAYDLVFRHALDIDATGERLAFGSTTGAVWVTENGGDSWAEVTAHLPPIHAVTFA